MKVFETSAVVTDDGKLQVSGMPFQAGTRVDVTVVERASPDEGTGPVAADTEQLMAALDRGGNVQPVGALGRDELYDRGMLR